MDLLVTQSYQCIYDVVELSPNHIPVLRKYSCTRELLYECKTGLNTSTAASGGNKPDLLNDVIDRNTAGLHSCILPAEYEV